MKRILIGLLSLCIALGSWTTVSFAETVDNDEATLPQVNEEAINEEELAQEDNLVEEDLVIDKGQNLGSSFVASKTVKMTAFDQVIKRGSIVYCAGGEGIYKVDVTDEGKVTGIALLSKKSSDGAYSYFTGMKKKDKYIYAQNASEGTGFYLSRIHYKTGTRKTLAKANNQGEIRYVIKNKKIYYKPESGKKKVMKLNGKSKKSTSTKPKMIIKKSNVDGYSVTIKETSDGKTVTTYLNTPAGQYKLGSHVVYED